MQKEVSAFAAFIGIDWADKKHDVCLHVPGQKKRERSVLEHRPTAIREWAQKLRDRVALTNRLTSALKGYFPLILGWFRDKESPIFAAFLERWPTLDAAKRARRETLVLRAHNVRNQSIIDRRLEAIRTEEALTTDPAIIGPLLLLVEMTLVQVRAVTVAIERFDAETGALCPQLPDYSLFESLPGAGPALAPRLLVAFGERRERFPDAASLQKYVGVAPVTERSGNKSWVHWRLACPTFQRQTFIESVGQTVPRSFWAKAFYQSYRARGGSHNAALRALAFKRIRILHRCWLDRRPYDEATYLLALQKRHAPLLKFAVDASP
jgi:hypothetical protein